MKEFYGDDPWFYELEEAFYIELGGENGTKVVNCIFSSHPMHGDKLKSIVKGEGITVRGRYMETETDQILITHSEIVRGL